MRFTLSPDQMAANKLLGGPAKHILLRGGARSGKTFVIVRAICMRAVRGAHSRHAILRLRANAVKRTIWYDTLPKVLRLCFPGLAIKWNKQDSFLQFPNGSEIWLGGLDDREQVEKILGAEYVSMYYNECSQIPYASILTARTRLAQAIPGIEPKEYFDCNPSGTSHYTYKIWREGIDPETRRPVDKALYVEMLMNPHGNRANIADNYLETLENLPEKLRRRYLLGEWSPEIEGALWTLETLDQSRVLAPDLADFDHLLKLGLIPPLQRVIVAVDPSGCSGKEDKRSDEIGISVAGLGTDGHAYILADRSLRADPAGWGRAAVNAYHHYRADSIVAETNYGGAMVESTLKTADPNVPVKVIHASRGKAVRAEPVSSLFEQGKVHLVGSFPILEEQLINMAASGYAGPRSPDRADAMIWAVTELLLGSAMKGQAFWDIAKADTEKRSKKAINVGAKSYAVGSIEWQQEQDRKAALN
jgi:phage terminase large subunit-like protein